MLFQSACCSIRLGGGGGLGIYIQPSVLPMHEVAILYLVSSLKLGSLSMWEFLLPIIWKWTYFVLASWQLICIDHLSKIVLAIRNSDLQMVSWKITSQVILSLLSCTHKHVLVNLFSIFWPKSRVNLIAWGFFFITTALSKWKQLSVINITSCRVEKVTAFMLLAVENSRSWQPRLS